MTMRAPIEDIDDSVAKFSKDIKDFSIPTDNKPMLKFSSLMSATCLFQLTAEYIEYHVPAEFIAIDHVSMRVEAIVYEAFIPIHVMIYVQPTKFCSASEAIFANKCRRDVVCFHQVFWRATRFFEKATSTADVHPSSEMEFLDFETEDEEEEMEENSTKASTMAEAALQLVIAKLSSDRACDREEAASVLAIAASNSLSCRRLLNAMISRQPVLSAIQHLLHPRSTAEEAVCIEATKYPLVSLLVCLTKAGYMEVKVARTLHSMLAELDPCHCSSLVHEELSTALDSLCHIVAGQESALL